MATEKEIDEQLQIALTEVGEIKPWYDEEVSCWVFSHALYPSVECGEDSLEDAQHVYPLYLREFIGERLENNVAPIIEKKTMGRGGVRPGAGRPKKAQKISSQVVRLPEEIAGIAGWLRIHPEAMPDIYQVMQKHA